MDAEAGNSAAGRNRAGPHRRAAALLLVVVMVVLALAMWIAVPVGWLWIGSQLTETQQPSGMPYFIVGAGILLSMLGIGYLLARLNRAYMRLTAPATGPRVHSAWMRSLRTSSEEYGRGVLDVIMIGSAVTAILAMAVWFFLFAGAPK